MLSAAEARAIESRDIGYDIFAIVGYILLLYTAIYTLWNSIPTLHIHVLSLSVANSIS